MTDPNQQPPGKGVPPSDPTVAWWERPGEGAGQNPAQADPTVLRGNIGAPGPYTAPPSPYQSGANPQPYTAPPSPYQGSPQPYQSGANPQPYQSGGANPQPYPPQQFPQAGGYGPTPPQQPWGAPPRPPSSGGGNKTLWWVLGSIAVVGVLVVGLIAFAANKAEDAFGPDSDKWAGNYEYREGKNACELVDLTVLNKWSTTRETTTHTEHPPYEYIGGGSYDCDADNKDSGRNGNSASLSLDVQFKTDSGSESDYARWKNSDTKTTGKGYENGPVSGLGTEAYFASEQQTYSSIPNRYIYTVAAIDSNISVKVQIEVSTMSSYDRASMATAAESQVRKAMAALKK
ncbi:hypothetical protein [Nocardia sp. NPDC058666]|uniref:hypothetical protein n=1 Tax=unclassified Nocardia TaxID=2637762 RepID=UPI00364F681C